MTRKFFKPKFLGAIVAAIAVGFFFGITSVPMTASAAGVVPDWFRGVAGFWANEDISTDEFVDGIEFLIEEEIVQVPGFIQEAEAQGVSQATVSDLWTAINAMQAQLNTIQTTEGTPGPEGPEGPQGPPGDPATLTTYLRITTQNIPAAQTAANIEVTCDAGDIAVGGGGGGGTPERMLGGSSPGDPNVLQDGDVPNSWIVYVLNPDGVDGPGLAYVICADITP